LSKSSILNIDFINIETFLKYRVFSLFKVPSAIIILFYKRILFIMPKITLIAAYAARRCIGINNTMPWHLPEDFAFFKSYTTGKPVIMGRKTWESLPRKPLPGRQNIVITRQDYQAEGAQTAASLEDALALCQGVEEVIIMGGAQIYAQALPIATDLRLTEVGLDVDGDAFFPEFSTETWQEASRENHVSAKGIEYAFVHYVKA
jgi:dihydrofolate reductase